MSSAINRAISRNGLGVRSPMLTVGSADVCGGGGSGEEDQKLRTRGATERGEIREIGGEIRGFHHGFHQQKFKLVMIIQMWIMI